MAGGSSEGGEGDGASAIGAESESGWLRKWKSGGAAAGGGTEGEEGAGGLLPKRRRFRASLAEGGTGSVPGVGAKGRGEKAKPLRLS